MDGAVRPTKKQRVLLGFIEQFITDHGYSPSYREIMNGCGYNSIATVAVHINNLISRGHLRKRDHSARSLELTRPTMAAGDAEAGQAGPSDGEAWLLTRVHGLFDRVAQSGDGAASYDELRTLVTAVELLGLESAARDLTTRLETLQAEA